VLSFEPSPTAHFLNCRLARYVSSGAVTSTASLLFGPHAKQELPRLNSSFAGVTRPGLFQDEQTKRSEQTYSSTRNKSAFSSFLFFKTPP
jgi:hypothetical protein